MTSPTPGSTLPGAGVTFQWTAGLNVDEYCLEVGTTAAGANDLYFGYTTNTSQQVGGLPDRACDIYVRLWSKVPGHPTQWLYNDYQFTSVYDCGLNWIRTDYQVGNPHGMDVVTNGSRFVQAGYGGYLATSEDGITWTQRPTIEGGGVHVYGMVYCQPLALYVGVGHPGRIWTSTDGINWTQQTSGTVEELRGVTYGNGLFVIVGSSGKLLTSTDAVNWTQRSSGTGSVLSAVTYGGGKYIACGANGTYTYSTNGISWTVGNTGDPNNRHPSITYGDGLYVIGGSDDATGNTEIYTSTNGTSWTQQSIGTYYGYIRDIVYTGYNYIGVGTNQPTGNGLILISSDGVNWTKRQCEGTTELMGVTYTDTGTIAKIVGVGLSRVAIYSDCDCD
jgi:hypothetical protein